MNTPEKLEPSWWGLVSSLAELHQWELDNLPLLSTLTGRHLYYRMAEETFHPEEALIITGKEFKGHKSDEIKLRPGLTATVEIKALDRTVLSYLTKPLTKTLNQSLGER